MKANSLLTLLLATAATAGAGPLSREIPLVFEPDAAPASASARFLVRAPGQRILIESRLITLLPDRGRAVRLRFAKVSGHADSVALAGEEPLPGRTHYLRGADPSQWRTHVPHFRRVRATEVFPGVDVVFYGDQGRLEYDFVVRPGADPAAIAFSLEGAGAPALAANGDLLLETSSGELRQRRPVAFQQRSGHRRTVSARYEIAASGLIRVHVGEYDLDRELVIDPVVTLSTFLGGSGLEEPFAVATDPLGNIYIAGGTESAEYPVTAGVVQPAPAGGLPGDAFVTKLSPDGKTIIYSTFLGGTNRDLARAIAVDGQGAAYVAGETESVNFPSTFGAFQIANPSDGTFSAGFVTKLNADGSGAAYSTYLGGRLIDHIYSLAVDGEGNAYLGGSSDSGDFPVSPGAAQSSCPGFGFDGFVAKLDPTGANLVYSTRLCGSANDEVLAVATDPQGFAYAAGVTASDDFPTTAGAPQSANGGGEDGFVAKLNPNGADLAWATYLGGAAPDAAQGIGVDNGGGVYVTGLTRSSSFPVTNGAFQAAHSDGGSSLDAFVAKLNANGSALEYSTFLGGERDDNAAAIAVGADGSAHVTGFTESDDFPVTPSACLTAYRGGRDAFFVKLGPGGAELNESLFLGGGGADAGSGVAIGVNGAAVLTGRTGSPDFATTADAPRSAYREGYSGATDVFLARIESGPGPSPPCIALNGFLNAASFQPGPLAPGEIVSVFGAGLGPEDLVVAEVTDGSFPMELAGTRVLIAGVPSPVIFTRSDQVNAVVPLLVEGRDTVTVRVEYQGAETAALTLPVAAASPAPFTANQSGRGQAALLNQDSSVNGPGNPAAKGSIVQIFLTGGGTTNPPGSDGRLTPSAPLARLNLQVSVTIGGAEAPVHFAGAAPGLVAGAVQINAEVPVNAASGSAIPLVIQIGGEESPPGVTLAIQ